MKSILSTVAMAALALVASAAPTETAQAAVSIPLPARFALYIESANSEANGLRVQYADSNIWVNSNRKDGVFLGGNGRISIDLSVHKNPSGLTPPSPYSGGAWNVMFRNGTETFEVRSEEYQVHASLDPGFVPVVGQWVQTSDHKAWLIDDKGALVNKVQVCGTAANFFSLWWDGFNYLGCYPAQFRIAQL